MAFNSSEDLREYYKAKCEGILGVKVNISHVCGTATRRRDKFDTMNISTEPRDYYKTLNVATFSIQQLPKSTAFGFLCDVKVFTEFQKRGLGQFLNEMWIDSAQFLGYSALLCTNKFSDGGQNKMLTEMGWKGIFDIVNKRTNNHIALSVKVL